ncbi:MAG: hypothetical protein H6713_04775 [Myxococcales bacterium]|nr:hypothetical protein [Myxococcales bacterium]MCB9749306.1 hypothetical protein [Myxococcales bacterium]
MAVTEHGYRPPRDLVDAVERSPLPRELAYDARLREGFPEFWTLRQL